MCLLGKRQFASVSRKMRSRPSLACTFLFNAIDRLFKRQTFAIKTVLSERRLVFLERRDLCSARFLIKCLTRTESRLALFGDGTANQSMVTLVCGAVGVLMTAIGELGRALLYIIRISTPRGCSHLWWSPLSCAC